MRPCWVGVSPFLEASVLESSGIVATVEDYLLVHFGMLFILQKIRLPHWLEVDCARYLRI